MNLEYICKETCKIAKEAGAFIHEQKEKITDDVIEKKGFHDFVTYVDKTAEKMIVDSLRVLLPEAGYIAEEGTAIEKGDKYNWIIDPLDGTTNYIHGIPPHAVSIALMEDDKIVVGVVFEITQKECFYSYKGGEAFLNDKKISVSYADNINNSFIATGFPYYDYNKITPFLASLEFFMKNSHGVRRLGSAATDLAYVACGRFEAYYEYSLSPWDVAAGAFIVQQAGGKVCDFKGGDNYIFGKEIIATNKNVFKEFTDKVKEYMN